MQPGSSPAMLPAIFHRPADGPSLRVFARVGLFFASPYYFAGPPAKRGSCISVLLTGIYPFFLCQLEPHSLNRAATNALAPQWLLTAARPAQLYLQSGLPQLPGRSATGDSSKNPARS